MRCCRCERDVPDTDIRWRNPARGLARDAEGVLGMASVEYDADPRQADPGAAPYCSTCRADGWISWSDRKTPKKRLGSWGQNFQTEQALPADYLLKLPRRIRRVRYAAPPVSPSCATRAGLQTRRGSHSFRSSLPPGPKLWRPRRTHGGTATRPRGLSALPRPE